MHPIPDDLDLSCYVGAELGTLVLGPYAITFDFYPEAGVSPGAATAALRIVVEGPWELHDKVGNLISDREGYARRMPCALNALLSSRVTSVTVGAPDRIALLFDSGHRLSLFTEIGGYESLNITIPEAADRVYLAYVF